MQKVISFLEKNVEWMVLGLAGLWVLYVVWFYVITPPVMVKAGSQEFTPAMIDQHIRENEAVALEQKMAPTQVPVMEVPDFSEQFVREMGPREMKPLLATNTTLASNPQIGQIQSGGGPGTEQLRPTELVKVPTPVIREPIFTRDQFVYNADPSNPNKPLPPNAQLPPGVQPVARRRDVYAITVPARWDETLLVAEYKRAKIDDVLQRRDYLSIELEREEMTGIDAQGNPVWGNKTLVPPLEMYKAPVDKKQNPDQYKDWVLRAEIQPTILQPQFYTTVTKPWVPPITQEQEGVDAGVAKGPEIPVPKTAAEALGTLKSLPASEQGRFRASLTPDMKRELYMLEQEEIKKNRPPPQREPDRTRPRRTGWVPTPRDFLASALLGQVRAGAEQPDIPRGSPVPMINPNLGPQGGGAGMMNASTFQGMNNPAKVWDVWAHDETVVPGKTYRYRLRVTIKNPLYGTKNIAADQKLAEVLELPNNPDEGWSNWTQPVRVPSQLEFFVNGTNAGGQNAAPQVKFNIFRWQHGRYHQITTPNLQPGDMVGARQGDPASGVDYTTGWSVVDVRPAPGDVRVVLMDPQGRTETRFMKVDQNNPQQRILSLELQRAPQANAGGLPVR